MSRKKSFNSGIVYSTDPDMKLNEEQEETETLALGEQILRVMLDTRNRGGKKVTLITGFQGRIDDLNELAKKLKNACGTGGSAKDGEIIIQGDNREKIFNWLLASGYKKTRKS